MRVRAPILILAASVTCLNASDGWDPYIGTWEYRQRNSAEASGYDREGERLEIERRGRSAVARYFGLERMGDEGLYYTAVQVKELKLDEIGRLSFVVPERDLFTNRPANLLEAKAMQERAGFTRYELTLTGSVMKEQLQLVCSSEGGECPDDTLKFTRSVGSRGNQTPRDSPASKHL